MDKKKCKTWIWVVGFILAIIPLGMIMISFVDRIPRTIDKKINGDYSIELQALGSPTGTFGPQDGRVILKNGIKLLVEEKFFLRNDGKSMDENNWRVKWYSDKVIVEIIGEEQEDEIITIPLNQ